MWGDFRGLCLALFALPMTAGAASLPSNDDGQSWADGPITLVLDTSGAEARQPGQGPLLQEAVLRAAGDWNAALGVPLLEISISPVAIEPSARSLGDGISGISFSRQISATQGFAAQFGYADSSRSRWGRFEETDLLFNPAHEWQVYDGSLRYDAKGDRVAELHRVALHEMGHLLGLTHPADDSEFTIMRSKMSDVDALADIDRADARRVADRLFLKNRPRVFSPRDSRVTTRRNRLVVRGGTNLLFVKRRGWRFARASECGPFPCLRPRGGSAKSGSIPGCKRSSCAIGLRGGTAPSRACGSASPWSEAGGARGQLRSASASTSAMRSISSRVL